MPRMHKLNNSKITILKLLPFQQKSDYHFRSNKHISMVHVNESKKSVCYWCWEIHLFALFKVNLRQRLASILFMICLFTSNLVPSRIETDMTLKVKKIRKIYIFLCHDRMWFLNTLAEWLSIQIVTLAGHFTNQINFIFAFHR